ncbi:hypothetical protein F5050DRAFT_1804315 [Lentinula boryana]|uniref:SET domain-containing protein n=1 Tax=Lentinula boryana TaxID=40481 RepID=A0ABQ8QP89_9AGAR|nr:hypothetical protein F5050DRAFT_1804315 [Lentinula boryana]
MKKGFLTTSKAKQQLNETETEKKDADSVVANTSVSRNLNSGVSPNTPQWTRFSHGLVAEAGLPNGYERSKRTWASESPDLNDPQAFCYVTLPSVKSGAVLPDNLGNRTECCVSVHVKNLIEKTPGFPSPPLQPTGGKAYEIRDAGAKGLGVFATRLIRAGDIIMDDRPLIFSPSGSTAFLRDPEFVRTLQTYTLGQSKQIVLYEMDQVIKGAFDRMPVENQKAFMELYNSHKEDGSGEYIGRSRTNGAGIDGKKLRDQGTTGPVGAYSVVCYDYSRMNHCCCPNSVFHWHTDTFTIRVCAIRDIPAGEEISINYCSVLDSAAERAQSLAPYGILSCTCSPSCSDPALAKISDERRARFKIPIVLHPPAGRSRAGATWVQPALTRLRELEEENLQAADEYRRTLHQLVNIYCFLQDVDKVLFYAHKLDAVCRAMDRSKEVDRNLLTRQGVKHTAGWQTGMLNNMQMPGMPMALMMAFA